VSYSLDVDGVESALRDLGETADDVAQTLIERGVRGIQGKADCCPVANYLRGAVPGLSPEILNDDDYTLVSSDQVSLYVPLAVHVFVEEFDQGVYPLLVEERAGA
jgi:hypothetical protein